MRNNSQERYFEFTLLFLIFILGFALIRAALPFTGGILGALTLYILLRRTNFWLAHRTSPGKAPWIITLGVTLFCLIPLSLLFMYLFNLVMSLQDFNVNALIDKVKLLVTQVEEHYGINLLSDKSMSFLTARATAVGNMLMSGVNNLAVNLFTAILLLYFLLAGGKHMEMYIARLLPFSDTNKKAVISQVNLIVRSNAIGIPLLAALQGMVAGIGYFICGLDNVVLFAALTGCASIIPLVGTMIVWIPLAVLQYLQGNVWQAVGLCVYGIVIISQCDNVLRMILQKRMANTHPLITIFGVIAGLPLFGFMGVVFGPLIVAMFLLFLDMFAKQYILGGYTPQNSHKRHLPAHLYEEKNPPAPAATDTDVKTSAAQSSEHSEH